MTIAYWCVLAMGLIPYIFVSLAKFGNAEFDNKAPRDFLAKLVGWRRRANFVQINSFEALPLFAAAVIIAHQIHVPQHTLDLLAVSVVVLRIIYGIFYLLDMDLLRSIVWFISLGCIIAMFFI